MYSQHLCANAVENQWTEYFPTESGKRWRVKQNQKGERERDEEMGPATKREKNG